MFHKARNIVQTQGMLGLARRSIASAYRRLSTLALQSFAYSYRQGVRRCIPGKPVRYTGFPICHDRKWGDHLVPTTWVPDGAREDKPGYEATLVAGVNETVEPGDNVVIVGAGFGVTAVAAALRAGPSGSVQCFEASKQYARFAAKTAARNQMTTIKIDHAVVGRLIATFGGGVAGDLGPALLPSQLPPCNVLQMDCEGAEVQILREMIIHPRVIIVETHGVFGAPTDLVTSLLKKRGYVVSDRGVAEPRMAEYHAKQDIRVLIGFARR
jgi:hypothetical protein